MLNPPGSAVGNRKVGKYEVGKTIGSGNFSKVKFCVDMETGSSYAMKTIDKRQLSIRQMELHLRREIAIMKHLKHQNVVSLIEVFQTTRHIYIVMEHVKGGDLLTYLEETDDGFNEDQAREYFHQLIFGLHYCHRQQIAHRDLKPENLLVDETGHLKISDFGLSNLQLLSADGGSNVLLHTMCGTPNYAAPEVHQGKPYNGFAADVWSCGVILFAMLSAQLPFDDDNSMRLRQKIESARYTERSQWSADVRDLLSHLLCVDPDKRYRVEAIMAHPWFQQGLDKERYRAELEATLPYEPSEAEQQDALRKTDEREATGTQQQSQACSIA